MERAEAFEAGMAFMVWGFSDGEALSDEVQNFTKRIGLNWKEVNAMLHGRCCVTHA